MSLVRAAMSGTMKVRFLNVSLQLPQNLNWQDGFDMLRVADSLSYDPSILNAICKNGKISVNIESFEYVTDEDQP